MNHGCVCAPVCVSGVISWIGQRSRPEEKAGGLGVGVRKQCHQAMRSLLEGKENPYLGRGCEGKEQEIMFGVHDSGVSDFGNSSRNNKVWGGEGGLNGGKWRLLRSRPMCPELMTEPTNCINTHQYFSKSSMLCPINLNLTFYYS